MIVFTQYFFFQNEKKKNLLFSKIFSIERGGRKTAYNALPEGELPTLIARRPRTQELFFPLELYSWLFIYLYIVKEKELQSSCIKL